MKKYGKELDSNIHAIHCDFLDKKIVLPKNCKVIANPPYATVKELSPSWEQTNIALVSKELYSMFMEKIVKQSAASVIITSYSFMGGNKFFPLRQLMNNYSGFVVAFDNVPGNIFRGRKHGVFNSNTSNSVRAAITVVKNNSNTKGFRISPLIRFKTEERKDLLKPKLLEQFLSDKHQIVDKKNPAYIKYHKELQNIYDAWMNQSTKRVKDILSDSKTDYTIYMPNTCRYFTTAANKKLDRTGVMTLFLKDKESLEFLYCLINSSFAYWWWRLFDGGITYPIGLLKSMPIFYETLTQEDKVFFSGMFNEMVQIETKYIVTKLNAGETQENIKFPCVYRRRINQRILKILKCTEQSELFDLIHANNVFNS